MCVYEQCFTKTFKYHVQQQIQEKCDWLYSVLIKRKKNRNQKGGMANYCNYIIVTKHGKAVFKENAKSL